MRLTPTVHSRCLRLMLSLSFLFSGLGCAQAQHSMYPVSQNLKYGFIDGKGLAAVAIGNGESPKFAFIDTTGKIMFEVDGSPSEKGFSSGVAVVLRTSSSSSFYINKTGKLIAASFAGAEDCTEGLCAVRMNSMGPNHWGYINTSGAVIVKGQYDLARPFSEGIARVGAGPKQGYIDRSGNLITPLKFDMASDFSEGMAQVKLSNKWGYINRTGELVITPLLRKLNPSKMAWLESRSTVCGAS